MKKRYDILHAVILLAALFIANLIDSAFIKGTLLLVFSTVLIFNTVTKLRLSNEDKLRTQIFYGLLLFLDSVLAVGAIYVIAMSMIAV